MAKLFAHPVKLRATLSSTSMSVIMGDLSLSMVASEWHVLFILTI